MRRALIAKELREHGWVLLALLFLNLLGFSSIAYNAKDDGSAFVALQRFTLFFGFLGALVVSNRLVVREYTGRTQLFLETLPITRLQVLSAKLSLGSLLVLVPVFFAFLACVALAKGHEPLGPRYLLIVGGRAAVFTLWAWALAFFAGVLGRYRFVFWGAGLIGWLFIGKKIGKEPFDFPIFTLLDSRMAFERFRFPWLDLALAAGTAALFLGVAFTLALSWEGALSAQLARKMSQREKVFFTCAGLVWVALWSELESHKPRPLFELAQSAHAAEGSTVVGIATHTGDPEDPDHQADKLGAQLARDLEQLRVWLGLSEMPPLFVVPDARLDPDVFLRAELPSTDGVVIEGALANPRLDTQAFRAFALVELLAWYTFDRSDREPLQQLETGFAGWWASRDGRDPRLELRAVVAAPAPVTVETLRNWYTTRERLGACLADALATRAVEVLVAQRGTEEFQTILRRAFGTRPHDDVRGMFTPSSLDVLLGADGVERWVAALNTALAADRLRLAEPLSKLQRLRAGIDVVPVAKGAALEVHPHVESADGGPEQIPFTFFYASLGPYTAELPVTELHRFEAVSTGILPTTWARPHPLMWAIDVYEPLLECNVRWATARQELQ